MCPNFPKFAAHFLKSFIDMSALTRTDFNFKGQKSVYHGKVRDVYNINDELMVMVATDRISAFDVILPKGIPYKGQVLNQIAAKFLPDCCQVPRCHCRHRSQLEACHSRPDGDCGPQVRGFPRGDDHSRLPHRFGLA